MVIISRTYQQIITSNLLLMLADIMVQCPNKASDQLWATGGCMGESMGWRVGSSNLAYLF